MDRRTSQSITEPMADTIENIITLISRKSKKGPRTSEVRVRMKRYRKNHGSVLESYQEKGPKSPKRKERGQTL